jgi:hypothetical protein
MPPRTRSTHVGAPNGHARTVANENLAPFPGPPNTGTFMQDNGAGSNRNATHPSIPPPGRSEALMSMSCGS